LSEAEKAAERQANSKLAEALKYIPVPSQPDRRRTSAQIALASISQTETANAAIALPDFSPVHRASGNVTRAGLGNTANASTPSLINRPNPETVAAIREQLRVPLPTYNPGGREIGFSRVSDTDAAGDGDGAGSDTETVLSLGNLGGLSVKTWAVSPSTRVGSTTLLRAPDYRQGTRRAVPARVYSAGFEQIAFPLRADRFSGLALNRVAFAHFDQGQ